MSVTNILFFVTNIIITLARLISNTFIWRKNISSKLLHIYKTTMLSPKMEDIKSSLCHFNRKIWLKWSGDFNWKLVLCFPARQKTIQNLLAKKDKRRKLWNFWKLDFSSCFILFCFLLARKIYRQWLKILTSTDKTSDTTVKNLCQGYWQKVLLFWKISKSLGGDLWCKIKEILPKVIKQKP